MSRLIVVTLHPRPAALAAKNAITAGTAIRSAGMTARMLKMIPAAIYKTNLSRR